MTNIPSSPKPMAQRRRSSLSQGSPFPEGMASDYARCRSPPGGRDVTPTSPSSGSSLRPLPPPSLYQPPPPSLDRKSSISSRGSFSLPPSSPTSVAGSDPPSLTITSSKGNTKKVKENTGRWQVEEHEVFLKGLNEHGKQWKKIAMMIKTRSVVQVRTHAQKYFQKLLKNEKKEDGTGRQGKERSSSILSTSTATSVSVAAAPGPVKRKSSIKGNSKTAAKKRRVSLEPKPKKQPLPHMVSTESIAAVHHVHYNPAPLMPPMPVAPVDHTVIDPSFMNTLHMAEGELDDSLLDLLDDSSVEAVEQVIGSVSDDLEGIEPNPVSPSVSSMSLAETGGAVIHQHYTPDMRHEIVTSPNPEDFSIHQTIGTSSISGRELSPTSVACMMDLKDFEQKTSNCVDALDWLMDVGIHQLPAAAGETEEAF